eukprot:scaffold7209_cov54-Cyclotella_meneghiniana.AAC.1
MRLASEVDILEELHSTRSAAEALDTLQQLTEMQMMSDCLRSERLDHQRLNWHEHAQQLMHEGLFVNEYTMSYEAHSNLVEILRPYLQRKEYNSRSSEPIAVEHMVAAGLRHLQGGRVKDARHIIKTSRAACYAAVDDFIDAVNSAPELDIKLPKSPEEWKNVNENFRRRSSHDVMGGTVGAIDGFFQRCNKPTLKEVRNVLSYFSGHYESYGVNCQAIVLADLQFMYFGVLTPGSTNDIVTFAMSDVLKDLVNNLPLGLYFVGDAAYPLSEKLLTPYVGVHRHSSPYHDSFNYHLSQLRIRVEMAFGRLVNKFRILSGKINGSLERLSAILTACSRLHNFIIQQDGLADAEISHDDENSLEVRANPSAPLGMTYLPTVPDDRFVFSTEAGTSHTRSEIVEWLETNSIARPLHNISRRTRELQRSDVADEDWVQSRNRDGAVYSVVREYISPI